MSSKEPKEESNLKGVSEKKKLTALNGISRLREIIRDYVPKEDEGEALEILNDMEGEYQRVIGAQAQVKR